MTISSDSNGISDAAKRFTLHQLPMEVSDYAFDQLPERLSNRDHIEQVCEESHLAYESQEALFDKTIIACALESGCDERLRDMIQEVKAGDRDDYTVDELENYREMLSRIFEKQ